MPRALAPLWLLLLVVVGAGGLVAMRPLPAHAGGTALVIAGEAGSSRTDDVLTVAVFFPADALPKLRAGTPLLVPAGPGRPAAQGSILRVEPEVMGLATAIHRFGVDAARAVTAPSACAIGRLESSALPLTASSYRGSVFEIDADVGSRSLLSSVPLLGHLFED